MDYKSIDNFFNSLSKDELKERWEKYNKYSEGGEGENGGWIKIQSEKDLPKESIPFWGYDKIENDVYSANFRYPTDIGWMIYRFSHYQPLIKPEPPKL